MIKVKDEKELTDAEICDRIIALALLIKIEGGGDIRFTKEKK